MVTKCPVMKAFTIDGKIAVIYCGQWSCARCSKMLAKQWAIRCILHVDANGGQAYFWTFTMRGKYHNTDTAFRALPRLWDNLRKAVQRAFKARAKKLGDTGENKGGQWSYIAFVEGQPQRDYMPHFHVISLQKSPRRIKDLAMYAGFGYQAKEKRITSKKAAYYVAKYASKQHDNMPRKFRRVRKSNDVPALPTGQKNAYIVKKITETNAQYILRVADLTGIGVEIIKEKWFNALNWSDDSGIDNLVY